MKRFTLSLVLALLSLASPAGADIPVETQNLQLRFSEYGDLVSGIACLPNCSNPDSLKQEFQSYRGFVSVNRDSTVVFELERVDSQDDILLIFSNKFSNETRRWRIPHSGWLMSLELVNPQAMAMASGEAFAPPELAGFGAWLESMRYVVFGESGIMQLGLDEDIEPWRQESAWLGYRNRFWAAMIRPEQAVLAAFRTGNDQTEAQVDLSPYGPGSIHFQIYAGPVEPGALRSAHPELEALMYSGLWFWLGWICQALFLLLAAVHSMVPNWAVAIIIMSLVVQLVMWPLNRMAERLQDGVHEKDSRISPRLREIKKQFKGAEQAEKILALYKKENVHPLYSLKSLAGVMVIIPVFIGAFNMLSENIWLMGESFLWIKDLSLPDAVYSLPFPIPFLGDTLNLLPFMMVALSLPASSLRNQGGSDPVLQARNRRNLYLMSMFFFLLFYTFPAGMVLYWVVNNAVSLLTGLARRLRT